MPKQLHFTRPELLVQFLKRHKEDIETVLREGEYADDERFLNMNYGRFSTDQVDRFSKRVRDFYRRIGLPMSPLRVRAQGPLARVFSAFRSDKKLGEGMSYAHRSDVLHYSTRRAHNLVDCLSFAHAASLFTRPDAVQNRAAILFLQEKANDSFLGRPNRLSWVVDSMMRTADLELASHESSSLQKPRYLSPEKDVSRYLAGFKVAERRGVDVIDDLLVSNNYYVLLE